MRIAIVAAFAAVICAAEAAPKASFDCAKAAKPAEKVICSDDALAGLDRQMADVFGKLVAAHRADAADLRESQRAWLGAQKRCAENSKGKAAITCLKTEYTQRLATLQGRSLLVCGKPQMQGARFTLACKAPNNPLQLAFTLTGTKTGDDAAITGLGISKAGGKPQNFKLDGQQFFSGLGMALELMDLNFDGYDDIKLATATSAGPNMGYDYWLYDPKTGGFAHSNIGEELSGMDVWTDPKARTVSVNNRGSCCMWNVSTYAWRGNSLRLVTSNDVGAITPSHLPRGNDQEICGNQTEHFNEAGSLTRIDIALDTGSESPGDCEKDQLAAQKKLLPQLKAKPNGYRVDAKDAEHFTVVFDKPVKVGE